jgi:serine/threonine-protein kinase
VKPEHWKRVGELFEAAVEHEPAARAEFLAKAPAGDAALAEEVLRLLASDENAGTFLNSPAGLGSMPVSDDPVAARLELLREENPSLAADLKTLLREDQALGDEGFVKTEVDPRLVEPGAGAQDGQSPVIGEKVGAYTLESPIGQRGMGTVWVARRSDGRFEGRAAVKFLNLGLLGGAAEERFRREGTILARLSHPHIAHLIDAGVSHNGQPYLILEYVEGRTIEKYCKDRALDVDARIRLFLDVLAAVAHAHANLIVHRDLKPSNVLVTDDGHVKLLDFGIAKLLEDEAAAAAASQLTRQGERALTLAFAAPEQVTGNAITTATDVYALGVLLHLLLTGKHPAQSSLHSAEELAKAIVESESPRISEVVAPADKLRRAFRGDLEAIVAKALSKNPAERYASVTALAEDLRRYLGHYPISARPNTVAYRTKKFVRRNRLAVALATALNAGGSATAR